MSFKECGVSKIGIKLANHDFFSIIDEDGKLPVEKELELTTVRDNQESVQINLFKKDEDFDPVYVSSLIIEDLKLAPCGDATILLKLKLDEDKNLSAEAIDKDSGNKQSISISINGLEQLSGVDFNFDDFDVAGGEADINVSDLDSSFEDNGDDFSFDEDVAPESIDELEMDDSSFEQSNDKEDKDSLENVMFSQEMEMPSSENIESYTGDKTFGSNDFLDEEDKLDDEKEELFNDEIYEEKKSNFPTWLKVFLIVLIFGLLALVVALFLKNKMKEPKYEAENVEVIQQDAPLQSEEEPIEGLSIDELTTDSPQKEAEPFPLKDDEIVKEDNISEKLETSDGETKKIEVKIVEDVAMKKAVRYRVRWGDTLWDISGNFYKNPWAYKRIARYNKIKNPNKIIAGTYITIPAK